MRNLIYSVAVAGVVISCLLVIKTKIAQESALADSESKCIASLIAKGYERKHIIKGKGTCWLSLERRKEQYSYSYRVM